MLPGLRHHADQDDNPLLRLKICDEALSASYPEFKRDAPEYTPRTLLMSFQPALGWCGLLGCLVFFAFTSATWWDTPANFSKVAVAYAAVSLANLPNPCGRSD